MSEIELYICTGCDLECELTQKSEIEKQYPEICPHGMIAHYERPPFKLVIERKRKVENG